MDILMRIVIIGVLLCSYGCATMMTGTTEIVSINTDPTGANITLSDGNTCTTPCNIEVRKKDSIQVTIRKRGCRTHTTALIPTLSGSGVILGGLIDYGTGAVYSHQPNPLFVNLDCEQSVYGNNYNNQLPTQTDQQANIQSQNTQQDGSVSTNSILNDEISQRKIIAMMQQTLSENRYYDGPVNGFMDSKTYAAIMKYRKDKIGLMTPTVFDAETLKLFKIQ